MENKSLIWRIIYYTKVSTCPFELRYILIKIHFSDKFIICFKLKLIKVIMVKMVFNQSFLGVECLCDVRVLDTIYFNDLFHSYMSKLLKMKG